MWTIVCGFVLCNCDFLCGPVLVTFFFLFVIFLDIKWNHWDVSTDCEFVIPKSLVSDCFDKLKNTYFVCSILLNMK